jgi:hypothetical protein
VQVLFVLEQRICECDADFSNSMIVTPAHVYHICSHCFRSFVFLDFNSHRAFNVQFDRCSQCECLEVKFLLKVPYVLFLVGTLLPPDHIIPQAPSRHRPLDFSLLSSKHILSKTKPVAELDQDHIPNVHLPFHVPLRSVGRNSDVGDICAGSSGDAGR